MKIYIASFVVLLLSMFSVSAQEDTLRVVKPKEIMLGFGGASYSGDLGKAYSSTSMMLSAGLTLNKNKRLHGNLMLHYGSIQGQELNYTFKEDVDNTSKPNTYFKSSFLSVNYELHFNIINKEKFQLYIAQGIGLFRFEPFDEQENKLMDRLETREVDELYSNLSVILPSQLGVKYYLNEKYAFSFQMGFKNTGTDFLDNISAWGNKSGNDNILITKLQFHAPLDW